MTSSAWWASGPSLNRSEVCDFAVHPLDHHGRLAEAVRIHLVPEAAAHRHVGVHPEGLDEVVLDGPARLQDRDRRRRILAQDQRMRLLGAARAHDGVEPERLARE